MKRATLTALLCALCLSTAAPAARADEVPGPEQRPATAAPAAPAPAAPAAPAAPVPDKDGFVPESRPAEMTTNVEAGLPAVPLVAGAYGFIWLMVLAFVVSTALRTGRLEREIGELSDKLTALEKGGARS